MKAQPGVDILSNLQYLLHEGESAEVWRACPHLIAFLVGDADASPQAIEHARSILRQALATETPEKTAQHLRAACELLGWSRLTAKEQSLIFQKNGHGRPDEVDRRTFGARAELAGDLCTPKITTSRTIRARLPQIAGGLLHELELARLETGPLVKIDEASKDLSEVHLIGKYARAREDLRKRSALSILTVGIAIMLGVGIVGPLFSILMSALTSRSSSANASAGTVLVAEVRHTEGKGLNTSKGPSSAMSNGNSSNIPEGGILNIVCQDRHGQSIYDPEGDSTRYQQPWPVWDKLTDGKWVSDLYTSLPKDPGDLPPAGIPACSGT